MIRTWLPFIFINSFWQVCLIGLLTSLLLRMLRRSTANVRYVVWILCLASCIVIPVASAVYPAAKVMRADSVKTLFVSSADTSGRTLNEVQYGPPGILRISSESNRRLLFGLASLYALAVVLGVLRLCTAAIRTSVLLRRATGHASSPFAEALVQKAMAEHGIDQIEVLTTSLEISPATVNWPHAVLILPSSLEGSSETELQSVLSHEFAHIRRHDFQFNVLLEIALVFLFFHPVAHWIKRRIDESREAACDEAAAIHLADTRCTRALSYRLHNATRCCLLASICPSGSQKPLIWRKELCCFLLRDRQGHRFNGPSTLWCVVLAWLPS